MRNSSSDFFWARARNFAKTLGATTVLFQAEAHSSIVNLMF